MQHHCSTGQSKTFSWLFVHLRKRIVKIATDEHHRTKKEIDHISYRKQLKSFGIRRFRFGEAVHATVTAVTKAWTRVQLKKLRDQARGQRALERYQRGFHHEPSIKDVAFDVMVEAYQKASGQGRFPAHARQTMYQARPLILAGTDKPLGKDFDQYFTQTLLPEYLRRYPNETAAVSRGWQ